MIFSNLQKTRWILPILAATTMWSCNQFKVEVGENGVKYQFHEHDEKGKLPKEGDVLTFNMVVKTASDSVLRDSQKEGQPLVMLAQKGPYRGSFEDGMKMLAVGDSATFYISVDSLFRGAMQSPPPFVKPGSDFRFQVKLLKIETQDAFQKRAAAEREARPKKEAGDIAAYIAKNGLKNPVTLPSGVQYVSTQPGVGESPVKGDTVKVFYTGKLLSGKVFDEDKKKGLSFPVGVGQMIPGFDEAVAKMKKGEKGVILIPSHLGYGEQGSPGAIPPNSILVFDVQLIDFHKGK
ncbi:MAG: FKBP-type peptidyl-prolyl cis-trans isomerase [Siphonobacter sp.]